MSVAWHYFFETSRSSVSTTILRALADEKIVTSPLASKQSTGGGLVFFDHFTPEICAFIREASRNGLERLLAVATSGEALGRGSWQLLESGASDVFAWDHSRSPAAEIAARFDRWEFLDRTVDSPLIQNNLAGKSPAWISALRRVVEMATFTDSSVLITGESGTGKELVSRLIHTLDTRPGKRDLIVLDCTTVVAELSGSEFFGHERGAFTGAVGARDGAFALADGGTLFLDEVGELPPPLQAELLRVVQEHSYKRVGGNQWQQTVFRLVCATNRDLQQEEALGRFRRDFLHRIAGCVCRLPPLRERPDDIILLAHHFLRQLRPGDTTLEMDGEVRAHLLQHNYPGNVRELKQLISRISYRHVGPGPITAGDLPADDRPKGDFVQQGWSDGPFDAAVRQAVAMGVSLKEISQSAASAAIRAATEGENGNLSRAARRLGITNRALQMRRAAKRERFANNDASVA